jgi:hypothetical protein
MSEKIGCSANKRCGMMEYWNVGMLGSGRMGSFFNAFGKPWI